MTVVSRYNSKQVYIPDELMNKLDTVYKEALTIVEAPLGYGKTTAIRNLFENTDYTYVWLNVELKDRGRFFNDLCVAFKSFDEEISDRLKASGYPWDEDVCNRNISIIREMDLSEPVYLIIDNYQNVADDMLSTFFMAITGLHNSQIHIVLITQVINDCVLREKVNSQDVNYISKSAFEFTDEEIIIYYRKCGIRLSHEEAQYLRKYTDGWISAIYLQLLHYIENKAFETDIGVNQLIGEMFWDRLSITGQDLLIKLGLFENFTLRQAVRMAGGSMNENEVKKILSSNQLITYDRLQRKYYIHGLLRFFLESEIDKLEPVFKKDIYYQAGKWYAGNDEYFNAIKVFYRIHDYKSIYEMHFGIEDIEEYITGSHKEMFIDIIRNTPDDVVKNNIETSMVMALVLFMYHEKDFYIEKCNQLYDILEEIGSKGMLKGEVHLLLALSKYNRLGEMKNHYEKACGYMKAPSSFMSSGMLWTFKTPTVLSNIYRSGSGVGEQLKTFEDMIPYYYRLTGGLGKGADAMAKAEVLLNQMDFESAEILCHKALYMAETRNQFNIYVAAMFCLARISAYNGDSENIKYILRSVNHKMEEAKEYKNGIIVDMTYSYMCILTGDENDITGWLKDNSSIEKKCVVYNIGFANLIYGRYLIETGQYMKLIGISGQMLGVAGIYDNVMYKIYTYIYIAAADYQLGNTDKAQKFIVEALALACDDKIYLPFVENYTFLRQFMPVENENYHEFLEKLDGYDKIYGDKINIVKKNTHGLTKREEDIAKLAAERFTNREIALKLHISENTVKSNLKNVFSKIGIKSRSELAKYF